MKGEKTMRKSELIEKIKNNKKAVIIGGCAVLLVISSIIGVGVSKAGSKQTDATVQVANEGSSNINTAKKNISATQGTTEVEESVDSESGDITVEDLDQEANQDTIKNDTKVDDTGVSEENIAVSSGSTDTVYSAAETNNEEMAPAGKTEEENLTSNSNQNSSEERSAEPEKVWHDAVYENQYVVDSAAWDETMEEPVYEMQERTICNNCGADMTEWSQSEVGKHMKEHALAGDSYGYRSEMDKVQTGTTTRTIHHDETGHYESVCVQAGYWE